MNPGIHTIVFFFHQTLMNNFNVTGINGIRVDKEIVCVSFKSSLFHVVDCKVF